ncbi:hypothetical protein F25303_9522 [Fusarium sp. NRRL 25303]|nr:hypothetical protein F25303_9522 [Fusarium sp. NRRL 25303]
MDENHLPPGESSPGVGLPATPQNQHAEAEFVHGSQSLPINLVDDNIPTPNQAKEPPTIAAENAARQPQTRFPSPPQALGDERDSHQSWMGDEYIPSNYGDSPCRAIDTSQLGNGDALVPPDTYESQDIAEFIKSYRNSVNSARDKNKQSVAISVERMKEEEQYELAKLVDSHTWSQAQEDELDASWESGLVKAAIRRLPDRGAYLSSVFEISYRLCNMDPLSLLFMYHNFEFGNSSSDSFMHDGQMKRNPLWTFHFCDKLKRIMTHPLWTVICRTDDGGGFSAEEVRILNLLGCGNRDDFSGSPVLERFRVHQERLKASGVPMTSHAKLLTLMANQVGLRAAPTSTDVTPPHTQGNIFCHQAVGHSVPANNEFLPNNAGLGGFPRTPPQVGHFEPEGNPIRRPFDPDASDLTRNIADHRDQLNPSQGYLTNQRNGAQANLRNPFVTQLDPSPAQEPRLDGSEDGEIISIESSDEEMKEERLEHAPDVPKAAGGRPRKRKGQRDRARDRDRKMANLIHRGHKDRAEVKEERGVVQGISRSLIRGSILQLNRGHGDNGMMGVVQFDTNDERSG